VYTVLSSGRHGEERNAANVENQGIDFLDAALIFENPAIEAVDDRAD
jgi:uncharacterized DUF497 family protein